MNAEDAALVAAIREHNLDAGLVAAYLALTDDSAGPAADLKHAQRLCAAVRTCQPAGV